MNKQNTITRILSYVKPYRSWLIIAMSCMVVTASMAGAQAFMVKPLLDEIFIKQDSTMLKLVPLAIMGIFFVKGPFLFSKETDRRTNFTYHI
jgi:subfamily B ATP-binding cassette protein MsbA